MGRAGKGRSARRCVPIALVALLGLAVMAGGSSVASGQSSHAIVAKKKCKKKHKRSASSAKKKCKPKVHPVVLPAPAPLVRATLSWSANDEVDLHAFDANGNHAGWFNSGVVNNIPNAQHNGDVGPPGGTESFTDNIFVLGGPSNREFSYIACLYNDNPGDYTATFTGVTKSGASSSVTLDGTPSDGSDYYTLTTPGGPALPNANAVC
jgi:hypothetical protein